MDSRNLLSEEEMKALLDDSSNREDELKMDLKLKLVLDFPLEVSVRLGDAEMTIGKLLNLTVGTVIELDNMVDDPVDLVVNRKPFATGEVITVEETFGVRLKSITKPEERLENLR
ncbi:MAG: FliM/FliN family flagellar motor switch protein [Bacillota bacterium]